MDEDFRSISVEQDQTDGLTAVVPGPMLKTLTDLGAISQVSENLVELAGAMRSEVALHEHSHQKEARGGSKTTMPETDPPPEVVEFAEALVWKSPSFDVIHDKFEGHYPNWMRLVVERLKLLHDRGELLMPDLSAFDNRTVAVFSDYGGEHKGSRYHTYSFLVTGLDLSMLFQESMKEIRLRYGLESSEIAFKGFREGRLRAALPDYLKALNNLLPGVLFTLLVDTRVGSLFGAESKEEWESIQKQLDDAGYQPRKRDVIEKTLRIVHLAACLVGLLGHDGQKVFWMTDEDSISAGEQRARDTLSLFARALQMYKREGMSFGQIGGGTTFKERHTDTLDLLSAADVAAGALGEYMTKREAIAEVDITVKEGSDKVLQWMPAHGIGLRKVVQVVYPDGGGIRVGTLKFTTDVPQDIREVLIDVSKR